MHWALACRCLLWEAATALHALAPGGCLILRLQDCLTNFTTSVLYVLHSSFEKVSSVLNSVLY